MANSKVIIPIRNFDTNLRILQDNLLNDGSINFNDASLEDLLKKIPIEKPITKLSHPEVRYEVTDHCNASCIMCPRDEHEHGREHGIMDQAKYEKSIGKSFFSKSKSNLIDLSITPNRPDCLGVRGIARDLAASGFGKLLELKEKKN